MKNRSMSLKKALLLLSIGGSSFVFLFGGGNGNCTSNAGLTAFYESAGNAGVDAFFDPARTIGSDFTSIVVNPTSAFVQNIWSGVVRRDIPQDRAFANLLVD